MLIAESPWSPPFFEPWAARNRVLYEAMQTIAAQHGATYVDPNRSARLPPESYEDLFM